MGAPGSPMAAHAPAQRPRSKRRILIVDDHPLMRRGLTSLIDGEPDLRVCAEAATQRAGLEAVATCWPDLVIADLSLGDGDGLVMVREIHAGYENLPILVLTMHDTPADVRRALRAGARGYVSKQELTEVLLIGIRRVLEGETYLSPRMRPAQDLG